jgi:hypothetical protein
MIDGVPQVMRVIWLRTSPRTALVGLLYRAAINCASFRQAPKRIVLDIDDTFDAVHGGQQICLFNAHHDEYGFQPIGVFDSEGRFVAPVLRPAKRPGGADIRAHLRRLVRAIGVNWPGTRILIRGDSHYCGPLVINWCRANGIDFILGVAPTSTLRRHVASIEATTTARVTASAEAAHARSGASRSSFDGPPVGAGPSGSSPASRPARRAPTPASSSAISKAAGRRHATRRSTAGAGWPRTLSNHGRRTWPPTGPRARERRPTGSASVSTPELAG